MIKSPIYLVPTDYSPVADNALAMAIELAIKNDGSIYLLNIVETNRDLIKSRHEMQEQLRKIPDEVKKVTMANVIKGSIYEDIGKAGNILKPALIIMGTHGTKGMLKIFGSPMEKVVSHTDSPTIILQEKRSLSNIKNIVMPFDFNRRSLQISKFAIEMAKKFDSCIHLIAHHVKTDLQEDRVKSHQLVMKKYMETNKVNYKIVNLPRKDAFTKELIKYAKDVNADIIAATYTNDSVLGFSNTEMLEFFDNDLKIPVLTMNSTEISRTSYI